MGTILYILGVVASIWCVVDILKKNTLSLLWKIILIVAVLATSWLGLLLYYFLIRNKI